MQLFVQDPLTMIAAPVQGDIDGIPKGSHFLNVAPMGQPATLPFAPADRLLVRAVGGAQLVQMSPKQQGVPVCPDTGAPFEVTETRRTPLASDATLAHC